MARPSPTPHEVQQAAYPAAMIPESQRRTEEPDHEGPDAPVSRTVHPEAPHDHKKIDHHAKPEPDATATAPAAHKSMESEHQKRGYKTRDVAHHETKTETPAS